MTRKRVSMRKIKEILRLKWEQGISNRSIAKSCSISRSSVGDYIERAKEAGLSWPLPDDLDDIAIENLLFPESTELATPKRQLPSMEYIHTELKRKGVTLQLL